VSVVAAAGGGRVKAAWGGLLWCVGVAVSAAPPTAAPERGPEWSAAAGPASAPGTPDSWTWFGMGFEARTRTRSDREVGPWSRGNQPFGRPLPYRPSPPR
jgi:hypothetical protein